MIIILDAFGNVQSSVPESSIYRGSNDANRITVLAPLPASTQFLLACQLPNGEYLTEQYMSFVESQETDNKGYNIWTLGINKAMTDLSGKLLLQFKAISPKAIITSFECSFEVQRGVISAEDTALTSLAEQILAKISQISGDIADLENKKQDKEDTGISTNSWQTSSLVVGSLNNTIAKTNLNSTNIETNTENIAKNTGDIAEIKQIIGTGEDYIGQMEATTKPTTEELNAFVAANTTPSRAPKAGDVIIFVLLVPDDTDQVYKYTYNGKIWNNYLIPSVEEAKNGTKGIIEGTYGIGASYDTLVDIAGGQILNIYIKDATGTYRNIKEYINTNAGSIANIISGNTQVGNALKAVQDALGNVIDTTYITKANGVTKGDLYGYALPKTFNDTFYLSSTGYIDTVPTTPETGIQFLKSIPKDEVNFTQVAVVDREAKGKYQISNKNSTSQNYWITVGSTGTYYILVHAYLKKVGQEKISLYQEVTSPLTLEADKFYNIKMGSRFYEVATILDVDLTDNIEYEISVKYEDGTPENSEFTIYSNELYPSAMNLNIQGAIIKTASGLLGELPVIDVVLSTTETSTETNVPLTTNEVLTDKTECLFKVNVNNFTEFGGFINSKTLSFKDNTGADFKFVVSGNYLKSNLATVYDFRQVFNRIENTSLELLFRGFVEINENGANYIYVDMDDLSTDKESIVDGLNNGAIKPKEAESASDFVEGGTIATTLETHNETLTNIIKGNYLGEGKNISLTKNTGGVIINVTGTILELTNEQMINALSSGGYDINQLVIPKDDDGYVQGHIYQFIQNNNVYDWVDVTPKATMTGAGVIRIATDTEAGTGTAEYLAINPKQLKTAIDGLGSVFVLKGSVNTVADLPATGNTIGDVWYVKSESVGYIWLNDDGILRWEELGLPIDLSNYVPTTRKVAGKTLETDITLGKLTINGIEYDGSENVNINVQEGGGDYNIVTTLPTDTSIGKMIYLKEYTSEGEPVFSIYNLKISNGVNYVALSDLIGGTGSTEVLINAPESVTSGTLTSEQLSILQSNDDNYILFNNEIYRLMDKQTDSGYLIYSHTGQDSTGNYFIKCFTITLSTRGWVVSSKEIGDGVTYSYSDGTLTITLL